MEVYQSSKTAAEMEFALGAVPTIGANGNWFIGNVDTGVSAEGLTPYIGENGNWFIGDQDTGIYAKGLQVSAAEVGQTVIVKSVDENGKPTEWECVDRVGGMELIASGELTEEVTSLVITTDNEGNAFSLRDAAFHIRIQGTSTNTTDRGAINIRTNGNTAAKNGSLTLNALIRNNANYVMFASYRAFSFREINATHVLAMAKDVTAVSHAEIEYPTITALYLSATTANANTLGIGTKWELWGERL